MERVKQWCGNKWLIAEVILVSAALFLLWAARKIPGFAEWYSGAVYPVLVTVIGRLYGFIPVSVVELFLYIGIGMLFWLLIRYRRKPVQLIQSYSMIAAVLLFLYASCCGVNYYRIPFSTYYIQDLREQIGEEHGTRSVSLADMCAWLVEEVNKAYSELAETDEIYEHMPRKGVKAMNRLAQEYPALAGHYPQPKPVMVSGILSVQQCSGVYSPFTIEANYNKDMVPYNIPHTICHEMSHLRGFMREDEANFIGYLACLQSEDADFRYSGYLLGWVYAGNALAKTNPEEHARLHGLLHAEVVKELEENTEFWRRYEGEVAEVQERVNDAYLKANGQAEGVLTYGRVVDLMLVDYAYNRSL